MNDIVMRDYNNLIKYVGENCIYKDPRDGKKKTFRNLDYKGYLGLSKNPAKMELFDNKLKKLLREDDNFDVLIRKFNSKHGNTIGRISNSKTFFEIGDKIFLSRNVKPEVASVSRPADNKIQVNQKRNKLFGNGVTSALKKAGTVALLGINGICISFVGGALVSGAFLSLPLSTIISNAAPFLVIQGISLIPVAAYSGLKNNRFQSWFKNIKNKFGIKKESIDNISNSKVNIKENKVTNTRMPLPSIVRQPLPSLPKENAKKTRVVRSPLPQEVPPIPVFRSPRDSESRKVEDLGVKLNNNASATDTNNSYKSNNLPLDLRRERINKKIANNEIPSGKVISMPGVGLSKSDEVERDNAKIGRHALRGTIFDKNKEQLKVKMEKYLNGYGETVRTVTVKYLKLLNKTNTLKELKELDYNFNNDLNQILNSEIKYQNWRNDMMGSSNRKHAKEIIEDSINMTRKYQRALNSINNDDLQNQKEYLEEVKEENLDNKYIVSLCEIVIGKINDYYKLKRELDNMNINDINYGMKKAEVEKMYQNVRVYADSVQEVIKQKVSNGGVRR